MWFTILPRRAVNAQKLQCPQVSNHDDPTKVRQSRTLLCYISLLAGYIINIENQKYRYIHTVWRLTIACQDLDSWKLKWSCFWLNSDNNDDYKNWCKEIPPSGPLQVLWHIVDCGWPEHGWDFPFKSSNRAPHCFSLSLHTRPFGFILPWISGFLYAVNWVIICRWCVGRGPVCM